MFTDGLLNLLAMIGFVAGGMVLVCSIWRVVELIWYFREQKKRTKRNGERK